ncbi:SsrA-binding protein [Candidatus Kuenenbacteria bacterium CG08_land_8_20_14_0_20_37_23]|uniref:SsrA-binding protein n=2 Tax=Candidatus Kueneniibacteriota TaxID=1752740 RepID=A0A2M6XTU8_9BACT|nr:MAG: SsrA-binding protein [Candidatus Kuenenbacteria bacterium CG1_02_38_13]PIU11009.1 MAG: SsrA-binding protein [Candidatus Kuenenbacteria bacterium CG08_land_8_20_14_0_20_37_23]
MVITQNKQAYYNYAVLDKLEAGLRLSGPEVKSVKKGGINLKGSYINIPDEHSAYLVNTHISPYQPAAIHQKNYNPTNSRRLLLHKKQLKFLLGKSQESGIAIIPLKVYINHRFIKLEIGICRGKKKYDKRESIKRRDFERRKKNLLSI